MYCTTDNHRKVLVLNADYSPIAVVRWQKAIRLYFKDVVSVVEYYKNDYILSAGDVKYPAPAIVLLKKFKKANKKVAFSRKNVFIRDKLTCQYCGSREKPEGLTYDHVIPRAKWNVKKDGTPTKWCNIVACCYKCNLRKADYTLKECGMSLIKEPVEPNPYGFIIGLAPWNTFEEEWLPYIPENFKKMLHCVS